MKVVAVACLSPQTRSFGDVRAAIRVLLLAVMVLGSEASANDGIARVGAGGITFVTSADVRMLEEVLEISVGTVRVRYRFLNDSDKPVLTTVGFPMPAYDWSPLQGARKMDGFHTEVDGRPVPVRIERRALIGNRDVTDRLRQIGLSKAQIFETFGDCNTDGQCGFSRQQESALLQMMGPKDHMPPWQVVETALWEQEYPPGREIVVEHAYVPLAGTEFYWIADQGASPHKTEFEANHESCLHEGTGRVLDKRIERIRKANRSGKVLVERNDVEYILATGRNWKGPIGDFRLTVRKDFPDQLVSLCFPGKPRKLDETTLEFAHRNFVPPDKLVVSFFSVSVH